MEKKSDLDVVKEPVNNKTLPPTDGTISTLATVCVIFIILGAVSILQIPQLGVVLLMLGLYSGCAGVQFGKYKKYKDIIESQNLRNINHIASAVNAKYEVVTRDLQKMIKYGYFKNAYIDEERQEIVLSDTDALPETAQPEKQDNSDETSVRCPGCGANNIVPSGKTSKCEYCETLIRT